MDELEVSPVSLALNQLILVLRHDKLAIFAFVNINYSVALRVNQYLDQIIDKVVFLTARL